VCLRGANSVPAYGRHAPLVQAAEIASIRGGAHLLAVRGLSPHDNAVRDVLDQELDFQGWRLSRAADSRTVQGSCVLEPTRSSREAERA
jgi:hypothetical protein